MTLQECYRILKLDAGAELGAVKSAFRRLAFAHHPDLNSAPGASEKFREINEAYVTAKKLLENGNGGQSATTGQGTGEDEPTRASRAQGARAYSRQQREKPQAADKNSARSRQQHFYYREEEVLKTILNDPFARKVFEDIYSQIRKDQPGYKGPLELKKRKLELHLGNRTIGFDFAKGLGGSVKSWFKGQMDHEQTVFFPAMNLIPGRKVRITVEQTFSDGPKTIEVTLPPDFVVGRPIRLKGLGRKLGPLAGDLLLRILAR
ncbi:MAG: DnaJ domain-containing protein [Pseudodesulfovibrio sp.]|uniref:Heat shock protein DnaJ domain protein n=1 Tax=Pseudodesulfovibrio aespoeensis (strain ATCC 700646 / DSM 10631 / Aspo-2) TaxID=643562 RepID=E6VVE6_PSEA9|nr:MULTISPECIES: DnaJ domain-containing protein [Pseudodesulfovibrio]MBU4192043.1 DnaJ domain-containing protein [Pseudomonadota bacterium]ADU62390.1 heat shock protein DnaJ domain protein [Pseudodesulfovibrio aespoeensis Aspo-2]MBU4244234.1 DnaJ domain-containing protein [Pseudomonadota bacterium]MBU4377577.1 DnaJ domain-containing protein [Pseudomonadota bacterium]MBU4473946.1 DnaJ domain-containing protein [Pseudomonadota bacterium]